MRIAFTLRFFSFKWFLCFCHYMLCLIEARFVLFKMLFIEAIYVNSLLCHDSLTLEMVPAVSKAFMDREKLCNHSAVEL